VQNSSSSESSSHSRVVIVGSGPAGYSAAIYCGRALLEPVLFEGAQELPGGQLMTTTDVENFPGFPDGILGPDLMERFRRQALNCGAQLWGEDVIAVDLEKHPFVVRSDKRAITADALIIATGARARRLDIPGADAFWQKGVTACAICDGALPIFRNRPLFVVGGGDSAMEEALFLTRYSDDVTIVHRRDTLRASKVMAQRAQNHPSIKVLWDTKIVSIQGDGVVKEVTTTHIPSHENTTREAGGVFFAIGHEPNTSFLKQQIPQTPEGYLEVKPGTTQTQVEGVFAAGDVHDMHYRQAITASGSGCMSALEAERWLQTC